MVVSNRNLLFQRSIFRCYVGFGECTSLIFILTKQRDVLTGLALTTVNNKVCGASRPPAAVMEERGPDVVKAEVKTDPGNF